VVSLAAFALVLSSLAACEGARYPAPASGAPTAASSEAAEAEPTASTGATPREQLPVVEFMRADGSTVPLHVEVPPMTEYGIGLSGRRALEERGMLFDFQNNEHSGPFWMKNTHIDLDIAFVGADIRIISIQRMKAEDETHITSPRPYRFAIEAPAGWFERNRIAAGDMVHFLFGLPPLLSGAR
jgi:uncharacterized membrane protein (UPF0127 family)